MTTFIGTPIQQTEYCVTRAEVKAFLRIDSSDEDAIIDSLIAAASLYVENFTNRTLLTTTKSKYLTHWHEPHGTRHRGMYYPYVPEGSLTVKSAIPLPYAPLQAVTGITYVAPDGDSYVLSTDVYEVVTHTMPGCIRLKHGQQYPHVRGDTDGIEIIYVAGYGTSDNVPDGIKTAIKLIVGNWYENREATSPLTMKEVPLGIECLLWQFRILEL